MFLELTIRNFVLIDAVTLSLGSGLTVLTGETGAGKSILFDAMHLLSGTRASAELVRSDAREASVSATPSSWITDRPSSGIITPGSLEAMR